MPHQKFHPIINVSSFPLLDFYRQRLAQESKEMFSLNYKQSDFELHCPKAALKYDQFTGSDHGIQQSANDLRALGRIIDMAGT